MIPEGHPQLQRFILHENWPDTVFPLRKDFSWKTRPTFIHETAGTFQAVQGEGIYEIPVGPVHAGIIEPGHFRFSVLGEEIVHLQPNLGYVHKGTEKLFEVLPLAKKVLLSSSDVKAKKSGTKTENAKKVGTEVAKLAKEKGISTCVFDRSGYKYHGRVKALADGAREGGLQF